MIKKLFLCCIVLAFAACGSTHNVVRTAQNKNTSKKVVRTTKKPIVKQNSKSASTGNDHKLDSNARVNGNNNAAQNKDIQHSTNKIETPTEVLEATTRVKVTTEIVLGYIEKYKSIAKKDMLQYGIPASIILGQGILESGAGTGPLSVQANNHFGIKCHKEWTGPSIRYNDDAENECFRKYKDPDESYRDHSLFLVSRAHYSSLFKLDKTDYKSWAIGLKNAGYATDSAYPTKLIAIIERYDLQKFDSDVLEDDYTASNNSTELKRSNNVVKSQTSSSDTNQLHQVSKGDTLYSISRRYNITVQDLKKKNNISNDTLSVGQSLIIH
ncbi:MAG: glucosaminidase domain-containing protein [Flavobacterium sp.]